VYPSVSVLGPHVHPLVGMCAVLTGRLKRLGFSSQDLKKETKREVLASYASFLLVYRRV